MQTKESRHVTYRQAIFLIERMSVKDKEKLFLKLKKERLQTLLHDLRKATKEFPISNSEISTEVEYVRGRRYARARTK